MGQEIVPLQSAAWDCQQAEAHRTTLSDYLRDAAAMPAIQVAAERALALMRLSPGGRVLDVGCGVGVSLPALARAVAPTGIVVGLDHALPLLHEARALVDRLGLDAVVHLQVGDAHRLPFTDASFDAALVSRVLIHLHDPERALREMRRVVRPGGWVVAVEPDLSGMRVDHPDAEAARLIVAAHCATIRHPGMGLELYRRLADVGLTERQVSVITEVEHEYEPDFRTYDRAAADRAVGAGWLTLERANAALDYLAEAGRTDRYMTYSSLFVAAGRVPFPGAV